MILARSSLSFVPETQARGDAASLFVSAIGTIPLNYLETNNMTTLATIGLCLLQIIGAGIAGLVLAIASVMIFSKVGVWGFPILLLALAIVGSLVFFPALFQLVLIAGIGLTVFSYVIIFVLELKSQLKSG